MPVVADQVDDPAMVDDHIPDIIGAVRGGRIHEAPRLAAIVADRQAAVRADDDIVGVVRIDADAERGWFVAPHRVETETGRRSGGGGMGPGVAAILADVDAGDARDLAVVE